MPTPSDTSFLLSPPPDPSLDQPSSRSICPPEDTRNSSPRRDSHSDNPSNNPNSDTEPSQQPSPPADGDAPTLNAPSAGKPESKHMDAAVDSPMRDIPSPVSAAEDTPESSPTTATHATQTAPPVNYSDIYSSAFPRQRLLPNSSSSFLRPGSKFKGKQQSDSRQYEVQVEIKHVDMAESFLCGYLRIQGLTDDHPTLTTYFEGEIIGNKYTFQTRHPEWGSNEKVDMQHWARFPAWRQLGKQAKRPDFTMKTFAQRENIFMRWKEYFLVPDHTVRTISGASFEGFYYICFNQVTGKVNGIYFHAKSEKYQQLELDRVEDHGCLGAIEFR